MGPVLSYEFAQWKGVIRETEMVVVMAVAVMCVCAVTGLSMALTMMDARLCVGGCCCCQVAVL